MHSPCRKARNFAVKTAVSLFVASITGTILGVITDAEILKKDNLTVCLLADSFVGGKPEQMLRPASSADRSFFQPLLHLGSNEGHEASIEYECIVRHQREALQALIARTTQQYSVLALIEDQTAPLPPEYTVATTPFLCHGYACFQGQTTGSTHPEVLRGLHAHLHAEPTTSTVPTQNVDIRGGLEGLLPLYSTRAVLRSLLSPSTPPALQAPCYARTKELLHAITTRERMVNWARALDETFAVTSAQAAQRPHNPAISQFVDREIASIHHKISRLAPALPELKAHHQLMMGQDNNGPHFFIGRATNLRRAAELVELFSVGLARLPTLETVKTILTKTQETKDRPTAVFCGLSGPHAVRVGQQLQEDFGFHVNPEHTQQVKATTLQDLLAPTIRLRHPGTFERWLAELQTNSTIKKWNAL